MGRRILLLLAAVALVAVACDTTTSSTTQSTMELLPLPEPFSPNDSTTPTTLPPQAPQFARYAGVLPNGTDFLARIPQVEEEPLVAIQGSFLFDDGGGDPIPAGDIRYQRLGTPPPGEYGGGLLRLSAGNWLVEIFFNPDIVSEFGSQAEEVITRSVQLEDRSGWPVIHLAGPFTWGYTGAVPPAVDFVSFRVVAGCSNRAVYCSDRRTVSIESPAIGQTIGLSDEQENDAFVESATSRSALDPNYLAPGPLGERVMADLVWTGDEMIVWGGRDTSGFIVPVEGAAFDPDTDQWRRLPSFPAEDARLTRAVWAEDRMVVVSPQGVFAYDPHDEGWTQIADGRTPSEWPGRLIFSDGHVYSWATQGAVEILDVAAGSWSSVPGPNPEDLSSGSQYDGVLRAFRSNVIAVVLSARCSGRTFYRMISDGWQPIPEVSLATDEYSDCSTANQSAFVSNDLFIWSDVMHPAMAFSPWQNEWGEVDTIPLGNTEGPSGPVSIDAQHFMVPRFGEAVIFDAMEEEWHEYRLPGFGTNSEIVWTGEEFLAWGIFGSFDAWRWTPPLGAEISGGNDTR